MKHRITPESREIITRVVRGRRRPQALLPLLDAEILAKDDLLRAFLLAKAASGHGKKAREARRALGEALLSSPDPLPAALSLLWREGKAPDAEAVLPRILSYRSGSFLSDFICKCAMLTHVLTFGWVSLSPALREERVIRLISLAGEAAGIGSTPLLVKDEVNGNPRTLACAWRSGQIHLRRDLLASPLPPVKVLFHEFAHQIQFSADKYEDIREHFELSPQRLAQWASSAPVTFAPPMEEDAESFGQNVLAVWAVYYK